MNAKPMLLTQLNGRQHKSFDMLLRQLNGRQHKSFVMIEKLNLKSITEQELGIYHGR
jgi:hypothetical protein